jgi:hypothetical protein
MKLPRGVSADPRMRALEQAGYEVIRQGAAMPGCAIRAADHAIPVPLDNPLKTGTVHGILAEVALMRSVTVDSLAELL